MPPHEALAQASRDRLRPITTIAGLLQQYSLVLLVMPVVIGFTVKRQSP